MPSAVLEHFLDDGGDAYCHRDYHANRRANTDAHPYGNCDDGCRADHHADRHGDDNCYQ